MLKLKQGVRLTNLTPQMALAAVIVRDTYDEFGFDCVITSADDSKHGFNTLHGQGKAMDFRTKHLPDANTKVAIKNRVAERLGIDFDVVLEEDHLHCEFDIDNT